MSPSKFLYYSNPVVLKNDRLTEELVMQIRKPARPSDAFIGKPGYYILDDNRDREGHLTVK